MLSYVYKFRRSCQLVLMYPDNDKRAISLKKYVESICNIILVSTEQSYFNQYLIGVIFFF